MRAAAFADWAPVHGGLLATSARSYVSYLSSVERAYGIELDADWRATRLTRTRTVLGEDRALNRNTKRNRLSALAKYEDFCSATSG